MGTGRLLSAPLWTRLNNETYRERHSPPLAPPCRILMVFWERRRTRPRKLPRSTCFRSTTKLLAPGHGFVQHLASITDSVTGGQVALLLLLLPLLLQGPFPPHGSLHGARCQAAAAEP